MKIGVFDSGLGGLVITKALREALPEYDYVYYGDTQNLPYGEKDSAAILSYTIEAMKFLITQKCGLIIIACNTATAVALRYLQQKFVPTFSPDTKILGVVIPTVEEALLDDAQRVGVLATNTTVHAHIYEAELHKIKPSLEVFEIAAPKLVPLIEQNNIKEAELAATQYASQFENIDSLILGCTHYPLLKNALRKFMPEHVHIVSQDELMGQKLQDYLKRHMEIDICLSREGTLKIFVSKINDDYRKVAATLFPKAIVEEVLHA